MESNLALWDVLLMSHLGKQGERKVWERSPWISVLGHQSLASL